MTQKLVLQFF